MPCLWKPRIETLLEEIEQALIESRAAIEREDLDQALALAVKIRERSAELQPEYHRLFGKRDINAMLGTIRQISRIVQLLSENIHKMTLLYLRDAETTGVH